MLNDFRHDVIGHRLTIGRDVAVIGAVPVYGADLVDRFAEIVSNMFNRRLDRDHSLRTAKPTKRRVGHRIGLARPASEQRIWNVIGVVAVAQRARHNSGGQIRDVTRSRRHVDHCTFDPTVLVEADLVFK